ncbi:MAG TPA: polysaccharide biosynthesis C-terminal domain-containing protein [Bryobacteraceae bacterium]|jgi:O-antigen/teichoic acid export membrane protein|nr:polysaccharide biosynthesis C-terminal domain-containing protein [Bryobacteraceae bacterium]
MQTTAAGGNTRTIASNSFWNGLELVGSVVVAFATSIPMARVIGPERMGYFNYVQWLTNLSGMIGLLGIPGATRKYMAEYLGAGKPEVARSVFRATLRLQIVIASAIVAVGLPLVLWGAPAEYKLISSFLMLSLWPSMVACIPSQANVAGERMAFNTAGSLASYVINIATVTLSLTLGWNLLGIAIGVLAFRAVDCGVRLFLVHRWLRDVPIIPLPNDVKRKMTSFSGFNLVLMILNMIVWDRSDMIFLRHLVRDTAQISFFSAAVNLVERVQSIPAAFGAAAFATIQAQYGRDRRELPKVASNALWYSFAFSAPILLGLAAMSAQIVPFLYGAKYAPAIPVLAVAALLAIPKCLVAPVWSVMEAEARQGFLIGWLIFCAIANMGLDLLLIPRMGAMGAAIANGIAQLLLPLGLVWRVHSLFGLNFRLGAVGKLLLSSGVMTAVVVALASRFAAWWGMGIEVVLGAAVFFVCMRLASVLRADDRQRLMLLETLLPSAMRASYARVVLFLAPVGRA